MKKISERLWDIVHVITPCLVLVIQVQFIYLLYEVYKWTPLVKELLLNIKQ